MTDQPNTEDTYITLTEFARIHQVSLGTVYNYVRKGVIPTRQSESGHLRVPRDFTEWWLRRSKPITSVDDIRDQCIVTADGCWEWQGSKSASGYGTARRAVGRSTGAHRVSYAVAHNLDTLPDGMLVCHHCDNRICVNPEHLFLGSYKDNMDDRVAKGRFPVHGENNPMNKLTEMDVRHIRAMCKVGVPHSRIAKAFEISPGHVSTINTSREWVRLDQFIRSTTSSEPQHHQP